MIIRLVCFILSVGIGSLHVIAADTKELNAARTTNVPQGGFRRVDRNHPLYIQLKKHFTHQERESYNARVFAFLNDSKSRGKLSDAVGEALQYANYIENHGIKSLLVDIIQLFSPLIKIKVSTIVMKDNSDIVDHPWSMYFPKNDSLAKATNAIVYMLRNLIDKSVIHESFSSIKSSARLSLFFMNSAEDETGFSILMNGNSQSFAQTLGPDVHANSNPGSSSTSHLIGDIHKEQSNLMIAIKKEKEIERIVYYNQGLNRELSKLQGAIGYEDGEDMAGISRVWGKNGWILQNYVEANFNRQKQAYDRFVEAPEQENRENPIYLHSDGFHYVDLGLKSILKDSRVVMKLSPLNTEYLFQFEGWATVSPDSGLAELLEKLPRPQWDIPMLEDKLAISSFVFDAKDIYGANRARFLKAIPYMEEGQYIDWLKEQLAIQIKAVLTDKTHAEVSWYASLKNYTFCLPLYYKDELVLVAGFEVDESSTAMRLVMRAVLLPIWAYNNARVLGIPKSSWMKRYAAALTPQEENGQKARQRAEKVSEEAHESPDQTDM